MPDAVSAAQNAPVTYGAAQQIDRGDQMGKDTFLKLLVAQMRYQDPSKPVDSTQMIAQTATFAQVEKMEQLVALGSTAAVLQEHAAAGAMVGREVTYTSTTGTSVSGLVTSVRLASGSSEAIAIVGGKEVQVGRITAISTPTPSSGTSSSAAS